MRYKRSAWESKGKGGSPDYGGQIHGDCDRFELFQLPEGGCQEWLGNLAQKSVSIRHLIVVIVAFVFHFISVLIFQLSSNYHSLLDVFDDSKDNIELMNFFFLLSNHLVHSFNFPIPPFTINYFQWSYSLFLAFDLQIHERKK